MKSFEALGIHPTIQRRDARCHALAHSRALLNHALASASFLSASTFSLSLAHDARGILKNGPEAAYEMSPMRAAYCVFVMSTVCASAFADTECRVITASLRMCSRLTRPRINVVVCLPVSGTMMSTAWKSYGGVSGGKVGGGGRRTSHSMLNTLSFARGGFTDNYITPFISERTSKRVKVYVHWGPW